MTLTDIALQPKLTILSESQKKQIAQAALKVLSQTGMYVMHPEAVELLKDAGCRIEAENRVYIPDALVEASIASAPDNIPIYNREGAQVMDLGGRRAYFGTGSDLIYALDGKTFERHQCTLADVRRAAVVCDALPNVDFVMSFAHPHEISPERAYLESFETMSCHTVKPIVCTAAGRTDLREMWAISKILRGSESELRSKPYWIQYAEPISPLKHPFDSLDKLLFCAETGMPVIYSPAPIAGSTAPMTIAGHLIQGLSESLCGLVIHQLKSKGAPFLIGVGPAVLDMATGQCSYNAPEYLMAYVAMVEMSQYFDLPNWGYAGTSDAQIPDGQATFEAGWLTFLSASIGSNLNHDLGYLDFGRTGCLEMVVILNEIIDQVRRFQQGIPVDDDHIGLDVIHEAGLAGQFLTHDHTLKHVRTTQWRPRLICRQGYEKWEKEGRTSLLERARHHLSDILENHQPAALAPEKQAAIRERVSLFKA